MFNLPATNNKKLDIQFDALPQLNQSSILYHLKGEEACSEPFTYHLSFLTDQLDMDALELVGQGVTFGVSYSFRKAAETDKMMHRHGLIRRVSMGPVLQQRDFVTPMRSYTVQVQPWFAFLQASRHRRSFEHQSVLDIFSTILKDYPGLKTDHDILASYDDYKPYEVRVQFDESDFDFLSRILADEGLFYYFQHKKNDNQWAHEMVLVDKHNQTLDVETPGPVRFRGSHQGAGPDMGIDTWEYNFDFQPQTWIERDYDFSHQTPNGQLIHAETPAHPEYAPPALANEASALQPPNKHFPKFSVQEYGRYMLRDTEPNGNRMYPRSIHGEMGLGIRRMAERESQAIQVHGTSNIRSFIAGARFTFQPTTLDMRHAVAQLDKDRQYLIVRLKTEAGIHVDGLSQTRGGDFYSNEFECQDAVQSFWPKPLPMPFVAGPHTAVVVDESGNVGYNKNVPVIDEHGRVKVRYHWDVEGKASCWVRVSQSWAGPQHGTMMFPLVGHEVLVDFLENNPDRPIVMGRVYNGHNKHPLPLDDEVRQRNANQMVMADPLGNSIRLQHITGEPQMVFHTVDADQNVSTGGNPAYNNGNTTTTIHLGTTPRHTSIVSPNPGDHGKKPHDRIVRNGIYSITAGAHSTKIAEDLRTQIGGSSFCQLQGDDYHYTGGDRFETVRGKSFTNIVDRCFVYIGQDRSRWAEHFTENYAAVVGVDGPVHLKSKSNKKNGTAYYQECEGDYKLVVKGRHSVTNENEVKNVNLSASSAVNIGAKAEFNLSASVKAQTGVAAEFNLSAVLKILAGLTVQSQLLSVSLHRLNLGTNMIKAHSTEIDASRTGMKFDMNNIQKSISQINWDNALCHLIL